MLHQCGFSFLWKAHQSLRGKYLNSCTFAWISIAFQMKAIYIKLNFTSILVGYSPLGMVNNGDYLFTLLSCKQTRQQQILSLRRVSTTTHVCCHPVWIFLFIIKCTSSTYLHVKRPISHCVAIFSICPLSHQSLQHFKRMQFKRNSCAPRE